LKVHDPKSRFWRISAAGIFFQGGAAAVDSGTTIAMLGYLMEISPDERRPAYGGYFNALVAPAALPPLAGAAIVEASSLSGVFAVSLGAAILQYLTVRRPRGLFAAPAQA
jgi:hypothetical protein